MNEALLKRSDRRNRLTNKTFKFPQEIKDHFYTANYFSKTEEIIKTHLKDTVVTMQFFAREHGVLCGVDQALSLLATFAVKPESLTVEALFDGDTIKPFEPVLKITGPYVNFGFLESLIDGILTRQTNIATNSKEVVKAAQGKEVFSMADRQDDYLTQAGDGYASFIGGITKFSTDAQGSYVDINGMGTMPHALIAMTGGDVVTASRLFLETFPETPLTALVDYHNDSVGDSLKVARAFGKKLSAIRLDTSRALADVVFSDGCSNFEEVRGVSKALVFKVREALDREGFNYVKIVVSSGFNAEKIQDFEKDNVPVDMYGVGTYLLNNKTIGFTGDIVKVNGKAQAKVGREEYFSTRLETVKLTKN
ncbi:MAG TPA: nicotinate phosphoribosyltransferase [Bacilli bacterium]|nr:nicotinate phosphoribosyltransferase [Bacilli bacterium]